MFLKTNLIDTNNAIGNTIFIDTRERCILAPLPHGVNFLRQIQFGATFGFYSPRNANSSRVKCFTGSLGLPNSAGSSASRSLNARLKRRAIF